MSCIFQYYAMLSGGTCARLFGFRSEGVEVGVGVVVRRIDLLIGTLSKRLEARRRGGGGGVTSTQAKLSMQNSIHQSNII